METSNLLILIVSVSAVSATLAVERLAPGIAKLFGRHGRHGHESASHR